MQLYKPTWVQAQPSRGALLACHPPRACAARRSCRLFQQAPHPCAAPTHGPCHTQRRVAAAFTRGSPGAGQDGAVKLPPAQYLLLEPPGSSPPTAPDVLLLAVAGTSVQPDALQPLLEAVQVAAAAGVRCWVQVVSLDLWALTGLVKAPGQTMVQIAAELEASPLMDQALQEALAAAVTAGFPLQSSATGRASNVVVLGHSMAGPLVMLPAFRAAAGFIGLASGLNSRYLLHEVASLSDWGRPVLLVGGELDGQNRCFFSAPWAYEAALLAQEAGPHFAATQKPFVLIPGANHHQTYVTPDFSAARGDIPSDVGDEKARASFASVIAAFLLAHMSQEQEQRAAAGDQLLQVVRETAERMGPWFLATGQGDVAAAWAGTGDGPTTPPGATASLDLATASTAGPSSTSNGTSNGSSHHAPSHKIKSTELLPHVSRTANSRTSTAVHPHMVAKAQRFARAAQMQLASSLPQKALQQVKVMVNVHMDLQSFLYNQPQLHRCPEGGWLLVVHELLAFNTLAAPGPAQTLQPTAPEYWLKLKRPQAIAEEMGLSGTFADGVTAQQLQERSLAAALAAVPQAAAERYKRRGMHLTFLPDQLAPDMNAKKFFTGAKLNFQVTPAGDAGGRRAPSITCVSPRLVTPMLGDMRAAGREVAPSPMNQQFSGNWYVKVMSIAQAVEWVMLDSLRGSVHWP